MITLFSKSCEYAFQAIIYLAGRPIGKPALQREISNALSIPPHFLGKILQTLRQHGYITSQKGKNGGFSLSKSSRDISLLGVAQLFEGPDFLAKCVIGFPGCSDDVPCPFHKEWKVAKELIIEMIQYNRVNELSELIDSKLAYIKDFEI
ncbi:MAG: Rrf2 family transcriptional regulator [Candidatus Neomarinimicrobiota bacterium]